jgi:hypothetical protein
MLSNYFGDSGFQALRQPQQRLESFCREISLEHAPHHRQLQSAARERRANSGVPGRAGR